MAAVKASLISQPKRGRRTLLTADLQERICAFIRQGSYEYSAAEACGISRHTFFEWLARGEGRDSQRRRDRRYVEFACAVRRAQAEARVLAEIQIKKMDPKWRLGRMHRDQPGEPAWSNPQRTESAGELPPSVMAVRRYLLHVEQTGPPPQAAINVESRPLSDGEAER